MMMTPETGSDYTDVGNGGTTDAATSTNDCVIDVAELE